MKTDARFQFCRRKRYKNGFQNCFSWKKGDPRLFTFLIFFNIFWIEIIQLHAFGGSWQTGSLTWKTLQKYGFRGCEEKSKQGLKQRKLMLPKMGCLEAFDNGVPMLHNISAPFLNALDDKLQVGISRDTLRRMKRFHREKTLGRHACRTKLPPKNF